MSKKNKEQGGTDEQMSEENEDAGMMQARMQRCRESEYKRVCEARL